MHDKIFSLSLLHMILRKKKLLHLFLGEEKSPDHVDANEAGNNKAELVR